LARLKPLIFFSLDRFLSRAAPTRCLSDPKAGNTPSALRVDPIPSLFARSIIARLLILHRHHSSSLVPTCSFTVTRHHRIQRLKKNSSSSTTSRDRSSPRQHVLAVGR
jgi:hypothetical protein